MFIHKSKVKESSPTVCPLSLPSGVECDSVVVQMLWERFGAGELYLPFYGFVSCVARLQVLFGKKEESSVQSRIQTIVKPFVVTKYLKLRCMTFCSI